MTLNVPVRWIPQQLDISYASAKNLNKTVSMKSYKLQIVHKLQSEGFDRRQHIALSFIEMSELNSIFW